MRLLVLLGVLCYSGDAAAAPLTWDETMAGVLAEIEGTEKNPRFDIGHLERGAASVLDKYGALINQWRGFIPASVVAVRIYVETGGNPKTYAASTGEAGLLQLWPETQQKYGVTNPYDPAQNIRAGCLLWQERTKQLQASWASKGLLQSLDQDFWAVAQLNTMIGAGATKKLLEVAKARPGSEYRDIVAYVRTAGEGLESLRSWFGTQSAALVARRVVAAGRMTLAAFGSGGSIVAMVVAGVAAYLLVKYLRRS